MFAIEGIDHVALAVRDAIRAANWYIEVLGFERRHQGMWNDIPVFVGKGTTGIALFPVDGKPLPPPSPQMIAMRHLAFRVDYKNFSLAQRELEKRGIKFAFEDHEIAHSIYFRDPDGHQLEITTYEIR